MIRLLAATLLYFWTSALFAQQFNPPLFAAASGSTGSLAPAFAAKAGITNWLCGFDVSGAGSGLMSPIQVSGIEGSNLFYYGVSAGVAPFVVRYSPCIPATGPNTAISISTTADASATAAYLQMYGFTSQ